MKESNKTVETHGIPLCLDLDGTLLRSDLLYESLLSMLARQPWTAFLLPFWLIRGKAHLKRQITLRSEVDPTNLPYDERVLALIERAREQSRPVVLCTASDELLATRVGEHLGMDRTLASDGRTNLGGRWKAAALVDAYGEKRFDYAGNGSIDLQVWRHARRAIVIGSKELAGAAAKIVPVEAHIPDERGGLQSWLKAIRVHQWLKNLLVFVPLLASHRFFDITAVGQSSLAFVAFSLCASGVYVLNDLLDLSADRKHPRKRLRPFAAARLPILHGLIVAPILTVAGFAIAACVSVTFLLVLALYYALTLAYSLQLKRMSVIDVIMLAGLYTIRIVAGTVAIDAEMSFWLLSFSMFIFLSLAILKRYTELAVMLGQGKKKASGRGYTVEDLPLLQSLGAGSGYIAVLVLALYINSPESVELYSHPQLIWLICPLALYWISRAWLVAHRGLMDDDPIVFAAKDRVSQLIAVSAIVVVATAT